MSASAKDNCECKYFDAQLLIPWVLSCSSAGVPTSWSSSGALFPAPPRYSCSACESGAARTWHSKLSPCSGHLSPAHWPRYMGRSPAKRAPVGGRRHRSLICESTNEMREAITLKNAIHSFFWKHTKSSSYLIYVGNAVRNIIFCAKGTDETVGTLGQGHWREHGHMVVLPWRGHCHVWYAGNLMVS